MPAAKKLNATAKSRVLASLPHDTTRVQVVDEKGKTCWKKPTEVGTQDQIVFNSHGDPVVMKGTPGRKAKPSLEPVNENVGEIMEAKEEHFKEDELLTAIKDNPEADDVLDIVMVGLAQEAASLEFERREAERQGKDTSTYSLRRANILRATGEMWIKRKEKIEAGMLDMDSPAFEALFGFILETFKDTMTECGLREELMETVFAKLGKRIGDGWKSEAKARMKESK